MNRAPLAGQRVWVRHPIPLHHFLSLRIFWSVINHITFSLCLIESMVAIRCHCSLSNGI